MWTDLAKLKNCYLHKTLSNRNARILNQSICEANYEKVYRTHESVEFNFEESLQPESFGCNVEKTHAPVGYGRLGIPLLVRGINSNDKHESVTSLNSLINELFNPEKLVHALRIHAVKRLDDCLHRRIIKIKEELIEAQRNRPLAAPDDCPIKPKTMRAREIEALTNDQTIYRIFRCLAILAKLFNGSERILQQPVLFKNTYALIEYDINSLNTLIMKTFREMADHTSIAQSMVNQDILSNLFARRKCLNTIPEYYITLAGLFDGGRHIEFNPEHFEFLKSKLNIADDELMCYVMRAFAVLLSRPEAQRLADKADIIPILFGILTCNDYSHMTLQHTVMALQNMTLSTPSRWRCREFYNLPKVLINLAHTKENPNLQLACFQALRQITEMPSTKMIVRGHFMECIANVNYETLEVKEKRDSLLAWLRSEVYPKEESCEEICKAGCPS